jgi:formylmethanofuran dehydrogenase subunit E
MVCGGFMVELAYQNLPETGLFDAISETRACLPDAIQLLTPCTIGNGWLKIIDTGRFAISVYDKYTGEGVRVSLAPELLEGWPETRTWAMKLKPKKEQDKEKLFSEITIAGFYLYKVERILVDRKKIAKKGNIFTCASCNESFRGAEAGICEACKGNVPFSLVGKIEYKLTAIPVEAAEGKTVLHDMTRIETGISKGPALLKGQTIEKRDIGLLKSMGKLQIYVAENTTTDDDQIHENEVAPAFAKRMAGTGVSFESIPREGKIDFIADVDGVLCIDKERLIRFNRCNGVMCATRREFFPVKQGMTIAKSLV